MIVLTPATVRALDAGQLEELRARDEMLVVIADGEVDAAIRDAADWLASYDECIESDDVIAPGVDPRAYIQEWIGARSAIALEVAAALIRKNGGDELERAEFARLFAAGEPQRGLRAFLEKQTPAFASATIEFL